MREITRTSLKPSLSAKKLTKSVNHSRKRLKVPDESEDLKQSNGKKVPKNDSKKAKEIEESVKDLDAADIAFNSMIAGYGARKPRLYLLGHSLWAIELVLA